MVSFVVSIALAETIVRMFGFKPRETRLVRYEFDETLGWKPKKSHTTFISSKSYGHHLYYNNDGFPCRKEDMEKSTSRELPSIALIGDSFVEGYYLPYEQTLSAILAKKISKQVLNFGVSGYSPSQYLLSAREYLNEYNVTDIVVFLFPFNDLPHVNSETYQGYAKPLVTEQTFMPSNIPLEKKRGKKRGLFKTTLYKFALWSMIKPFVRFIIDSDDRVTETQKFSFLEMEKALKLIRQIHVEYPNPTFHVFYIPDISEIKYRDVFDHNINNFVKICSNLGLKCVIPKQLLVDDVEKFYIPFDRHFSEIGANLVANQLYDLLEKKQ